MRRALVLLVALILVAGCGGGAHDDTMLLPLYLGQTCFKSGTSNICTPHYILVPWLIHYDEAYALHLRDCRDTAHKCKTGTVYVPRDTYQAVSVGDYYHPSKGDAKRRAYEKVGRK